MSIVFLVDENPDVASAGLGGAALGGARSVPDRAARSNSERATPSAPVGNRFSAPQIVWNKSNRCAGERGGGAGGQAQMGEDFDNHRRIFDGGDDLQADDGARFGGSGASFPIRIFLPPSVRGESQGLPSACSLSMLTTGLAVMEPLTPPGN